MGQMEISLSDAIEIHAHVLISRHGRHAPDDAAQQAAACLKRQDEDGFQVWCRVKESAEALLRRRAASVPDLH